MKINVLKGERFEVNPEEINVTFDDVKGVSLSLFPFRILFAVVVADSTIIISFMYTSLCGILGYMT